MKMMFWLKIRSLTLLGLAVLITQASCTVSNNRIPVPSSHTEPNDLARVDLQPGEKLNVLATTDIVADIVGNVGGEWIELRSLVPTGADPHGYEPTPGDLGSMAEADVIFINGLGLEESLMEILINAGRPIISLSEGIPVRYFQAGEIGTQGDDEELQSGQVDPHVWFDPEIIQYWVERIGDALGRLDPSHAKDFSENAVSYLEELRALDAWIRTTVEVLPVEKRQLITDHVVFGYFARRYEFVMIGAIVPAPSTLAEPSAREFAQLEDQINALGVKVVFVGSTVNPNLARSVADDTGAQLVLLFTGSLGEPGGPADSYLSLMRYNVSAIVDSLKD
jgi:ABC-type Zn uptake system ZnuABC Zn-binding protein ZnuA